MNKILTTLCYLEKDGRYLMLHRTKKKNDMNHDKYIGVGGHLEQGESPAGGSGGNRLYADPLSAAGRDHLRH